MSRGIKVPTLGSTEDNVLRQYIKLEEGMERSKITIQALAGLISVAQDPTKYVQDLIREQAKFLAYSIGEVTPDKILNFVPPEDVALQQEYAKNYKHLRPEMYRRKDGKLAVKGLQ